MLAFAAAVWFGAALFIHYAGPSGIFTGWRAAILYPLTVLATIPLNHRVRRIAGVGNGGMLTAVALGTAIATMLDGVAMTWLPALYGGDPAIVGPGAAWLLWAVGAGLTLAAVTSARAGTMTTELAMLATAALLSLGLALATVAVHFRAFGGAVIRGNRDGYPRLDGLAGRVVRAHAGLNEALLPFAVIVFVAAVSGTTTRGDGGGGRGVRPRPGGARGVLSRRADAVALGRLLRRDGRDAGPRRAAPPDRLGSRRPVDQAATTVRRRSDTPVSPKPPMSSAHVVGSGTPATAKA